jgi:hypothetical protein
MEFLDKAMHRVRYAYFLRFSLGLRTPRTTAACGLLSWLWRAPFPEKTAPGQIGMDIPRSKDSS